MNDALEAVQIAALLIVALGAWAVVAARDPLRQAMVASIYGLMLGILFFVFQAPDVALSQTVVGAVAIPMMILLALAKVRGKGKEGRAISERRPGVRGAIAAPGLIWGFAGLPDFGANPGPTAKSSTAWRCRSGRPQTSSPP